MNNYISVSDLAHHICGVGNLGVFELLELVSNADIVQIGHCKDCDYYREKPWGEGMVCRHYSDFLYTEPEDFCSCFEKKEHEKINNSK